MIDRLQARGARTTVLVLDACRNNPFAANRHARAWAASGGLAPVTPPEGTFILFSAGAKQTALDAMSQTDPDPNSVFTRNFVRELARAGLTMVQLAKRTQARGQAGWPSDARHEQTPAYYDEIVGDFVLNTRRRRRTASPRRTAALVVPQARDAGAEAERRRPRPARRRRSRRSTRHSPIFMRSNGGWSVTLSFRRPGDAISWRLGDDRSVQGDRVSRRARPAHTAAHGQPEFRARPRYPGGGDPDPRGRRSAATPPGRFRSHSTRLLKLDARRPPRPRDDRRQLGHVPRVQRVAALLHAAGVVSLRDPRGADRDRHHDARQGDHAAAVRSGASGRRSRRTPSPI